jgi:hypothetical protein
VDDEAGGRAVGDGEERRCVHVADQRFVRGSMWLRVGRVEAIQLAHECERIGEVVATERPEVDAIGTWNRKATDRAVGIAEAHEVSGP